MYWGMHAAENLVGFESSQPKESLNFLPLAYCVEI